MDNTSPDTLSIFSPDSKFLRAMSRVADLVLLNIYFLLCSIPLFTIGAASTALYTVCFRFDTEREQGVTRSFFRAFRENFKQATLLWLPIVLCVVTACINIYVFYAIAGFVSIPCVIFIVLLALILLIAGFAFPLLSQFDNKNMATLKNALFLSIAYLPRSIFITVLNIFPIVLLVLDVLMFLQTGFIWFVLYFSAAAYINSVLLRKVFAPYMTETEDQKEVTE